MKQSPWWYLSTKYKLYSFWNVGLPQWVARHIPKKVIYFTTIRVGAHATVGPYGNTNVSDLTFLEALERWDIDE